MEFRARTTNNGFNDFIVFFSERDVEVRRLNNLVQGRDKAAGYPSAANVDATNKYIDNKVDAKMANLATAVEAAMDASALDSGATVHQTSGNKTAANVADNLTSNNQDAVLTALKAINECLGKVEKGGGRHHHRGLGRGGASEDADAQAAGDGHKPCVDCGKCHKLLDNKCWQLDANKENRPKN